MLMSGLRLSNLNKETTYLLTYVSTANISVVTHFILLGTTGDVE